MHKVNNTAKYVNLPTTIKAKFSTFGFGNKEGLKVIMGRDSPPPTSYRLKSDFEKPKNTGYSFGLPYSVYKKVHIEGIATGAEDIPGPGSYEQKTLVGTNSKKWTLKSRMNP